MRDKELSITIMRYVLLVISLLFSSSAANVLEVECKVWKQKIAFYVGVALGKSCRKTKVCTSNSLRVQHDE